MTVRATEIGYTMRRGCAATPKTALPRPIESTMPIAAPIRPPASPSNAASARNRRNTRRTDPRTAFRIAQDRLDSCDELLDLRGGTRNAHLDHTNAVGLPQQFLRVR